MLVISDVANLNLSRDKLPVATDKANSHQETRRNYFLSKACLRRSRLRSTDASGGMPAGNAGANMFACARAMLASGAAGTGSNVYIIKLANEV